MRTEVRIRGQAQPRDRHDIALLAEKSTLHSNWYGVRDLNLEVDPKEITSLMEVKLYPGTYIGQHGPETSQTEESPERKTGIGWLDDIVKLSPSPEMPKEM